MSKAGAAPAPLLAVAGLVVRRQGRLVLDHLSFTVAEGQCLVICGPSGCGKTTLLRAISGLDPVDGGTVRLDGQLRNGPGRRGCGRGEVGMVFQGEQLYRHLSLLDNITIAPRLVHGVPRRQAEAAAMGLLRAIGLEDKAARHPGQLSGGERQRGAIARALALSPRLMLFDEPTSALDPSCVREVLGLIRQIREQGQTMIAVTHQTAFARSIADSIVVMERGRILDVGSPEQVLLEPGTATTRQLFGGGLPEVSALDRVRLSGTLTIGIAADGPNVALESLRCNPVLALLARRQGCTPALRRLDFTTPPLLLRAGLADLLLVRNHPDPAGLVMLPESEGLPPGLALAAAANDALWLKALGRG